MEVQMFLHGLTPGMQDHRKPDLPAQILAPELFQELSSCVNEQIEEQLLIEPDQWIEDMVDGEDHMIIMDRQHPFLLCFEPLRLFEGTTLGTMTILAGFEVKFPLLALRTCLQDTAHGRCAAIHDRIHRFGLLIRKAMRASVLAHEFAEDLSHVVFHIGLLR
jgi:hypothetical protein